MADRKKVDKKPIPKLEPKKKVAPKPIPKLEPKKRSPQDKPKPVVIKEETNVQVMQESKPKRKSADDDKYVRLAINADLEKKREFSEKVQRGDLKLAYYAIDNEIGYHYYIVIKK
jgi:hypothetical protein